jgi:hypothetical protein
MVPNNQLREQQLGICPTPNFADRALAVAYWKMQDYGDLKVSIPDLQ